MTKTELTDEEQRKLLKMVDKAIAIREFLKAKRPNTNFRMGTKRSTWVIPMYLIVFGGHP